MDNRASNTPVVPLPNPGEGGPVMTPSGGTPVIPLPNPGEGGPVTTPGGGTPVIPLPNPGEGGPVITPGGDNHFPVIPLPNPGEGGPVYPGNNRYARTRFLNAAFGYRAFRIFINNARVINVLNYSSVSGFGRVPVGYQTVTIAGMDGYIYIQKSVPFQGNNPTTIAIINTPSGLDLLQIPDLCCTTGNIYSNFRVSNLALNSGPLDVVLGDGRVIYTDVRYKTTTDFKRIRPGAYQFFFVETNLMPIPTYMDIETLDPSFVGLPITPETVASLYLNVVPDATYTVYLLSSGAGRNEIQTLVLQDR